jgi:glycerophosphoryl diester phosphodiesterase
MGGAQRRSCPNFGSVAHVSPLHAASPRRTLRPEIIAHRGTPRAHPENSLPGFRQALTAGADAIELDVHLTADGVVVVHHDPYLHVTPAARGGKPLRIAELTASELSAYPLASNVPIPSLADVLTLVGADATVYVEVKASEAAPSVLRCIAMGATPCAVHSFDHRVALKVARACDRRPGADAEIRRPVPTGILSVSYLVDPVAALRAARARDYWEQWEMIDDDLVNRIHDARGRVIAWTVNDVSEARRLVAMGVDGICTDVCEELIKAGVRGPRSG